MSPSRPSCDPGPSDPLPNGEEYRTIFEHLADAVLVHDRETGRFLDLNPAAARRYGFTREQMLSMTLGDLLPPEERARARPVEEPSEPGSPELSRHVTVDGRRLTVEILRSGIVHRGRPAWLSVVRDVTDRVHDLPDLSDFAPVEDAAREPAAHSKPSGSHASEQRSEETHREPESPSAPAALIVHPDAALREAFRRELRSWGLRVTACASGFEALHALSSKRRQGPWHCVVVHARPGQLHGISLGRTILGRQSELQPLMLLIPADHEDVGDDRLLQAGFAGVVHHVEELRAYRNGVDLPDLEVIVSEVVTSVENTLQNPAPSLPLTGGVVSVEDRGSVGDDAESAPPRILVVEDNPVNQKVVCFMLRRMGFRVEVAEDGQRGVTRFREGAYDLVLMDCQMPVMDGYDATRTIRQASDGRAHTPVVALTANAMAGDREKCLAAGMDDYMSKPARPEDLDQMLHRWIPDCARRLQLAEIPTG